MATTFKTLTISLKLMYCTCGNSAHNIAEINQLRFFIHYLAAWNNDCSRFQGRIKKYFIRWLINSTNPSLNLHLGDASIQGTLALVPRVSLNRGSTAFILSKELPRVPGILSKTYIINNMWPFTWLGGLSKFHALPIFTIQAVKVRKVFGMWVKFLFYAVNMPWKIHGYLENFTQWKSL